MGKYDPQIDANRYFQDEYLGISRFLSYREQIVSVVDLKGVTTIGEIGKGNGLTSSILKQFGYDVTTIDFDPNVMPDVECSVLELKRAVTKKFNAVLCFEVLEHLQFDDFENALENLGFISDRYLILSLPYVGITIKAHLYVAKYGEREIEFTKRVPLFWKSHVFNGQHYWEVGKKGFSRDRIRRIIANHFDIKKEWLHPYNHAQLFFLCQKKGMETLLASG
jgi:hypothetical protein